VLITEGSGAGKTIIARSVENLRLPNCEVHFFDSIGVLIRDLMSAPLAFSGPVVPNLKRRVLVLGWHGYTTTVNGGDGVVCLVERS
jgi:hypothetical protein